MPWSSFFECWVLSQLFHCLTFIKRFFTSSLLSAIRVVSSACLRLLLFLQANLIPACGSSSPAFHMIHSAFKLNKQGDKIQLWHIPFPILNQSIVWCLILAIDSYETVTQSKGLLLCQVLLECLLSSLYFHRHLRNSILDRTLDFSCRNLKFNWRIKADIHKMSIWACHIFSHG